MRKYKPYVNIFSDSTKYFILFPALNWSSFVYIVTLFSVQLLLFALISPFLSRKMLSLFFKSKIQQVCRAAIQALQVASEELSWHPFFVRTKMKTKHGGGFTVELKNINFAVFTSKDRNIEITWIHIVILYWYREKNCQLFSFRRDGHGHKNTFVACALSILI